MAVKTEIITLVAKVGKQEQTERTPIPVGWCSQFNIDATKPVEIEFVPFFPIYGNGHFTRLMMKWHDTVGKCERTAETRRKDIIDALMKEPIMVLGFIGQEVDIDNLDHQVIN